eukprot:GEMP01004204.1.p1 GENE.GEMP01004204.1~~GEMP01004204.1.p1  ORF type:complete len:679 (+),score=119.83 GEMP01004204.1:241-2277(+)
MASTPDDHATVDGHKLHIVVSSPTAAYRVLAQSPLPGVPTAASQKSALSGHLLEDKSFSLKFGPKLTVETTASSNSPRSFTGASSNLLRTLSGTSSNVTRSFTCFNTSSFHSARSNIFDNQQPPEDDSFSSILRAGSKSTNDEHPRALLALAAEVEAGSCISSPTIEDPSVIPTIRDETPFFRYQTFFIDHWGRSPLTEYSIKCALGGDGARCKSKENAMMMCEEEADFVMFNATMRTGPIMARVPAEAQISFENSYADFDSAKDIRVVLDDVLATVDLYLLLQLQTLFVSVGCYTLAEKLATRRLKLCHDALGRFDPDTRLATHELGVILLHAGLYLDAEHCFDVALEPKSVRIIQKGTVDSSARSSLRTSQEDEGELTCETAVCLAVALREQGRLREAADRLRGIFDAAVKSFGTEHPRTSHAANELGATLLRQNRVSEAAPILQKVVDQYHALLGADHPDTLNALLNLAALQAAQGNSDAATGTYKQVLTKQRVLYGVSHPGTLACSRLLAIHGRGVDEFPFQLLVSSWSAVRGSNSLRTLCAVHDLGVNLCKMEDYSMALPMFQRAFAGFAKLCGNNHKATVDTRSKIFNMLLAQGDFIDAKDDAESLLTALQQRFGMDHTETCKASNNVGVVHLRCIRYQEAYDALRGDCTDSWQRCVLRKKCRFPRLRAGRL